MKQSDLYAVIGHPVNHSLSPFIHQAFAEQTGQSITYRRIEAPLNGFESCVQDFIACGAKGFNVTVPFKQAAWRYCQSTSEVAQDAQAVNTVIIRPDGACFGDNTDGSGLVNDLYQHQGGVIAQKDILILGAGGGVRGILGALLAEDPKSITVANRTLERAKDLVVHFNDKRLIAAHFKDLPLQPYHWIINATSASLLGVLPDVAPSLITPQTHVYDLVYSVKHTIFMQWCSRLGAASVCDGLGMLVEQAALSFELWRGVKPETMSVLKAARIHLEQSYGK